MLLFLALNAAITLPTLDPHPAIASVRVTATILHAERIDFHAIRPNRPEKRDPAKPERFVVDFE